MYVGDVMNVSCHNISCSKGVKADVVDSISWMIAASIAISDDEVDVVKACW